MAEDTVSPDILSAAASATQGMIPGGGDRPATPLTSFGPTPIVQPPPIPRFQPPQIQMPTPGGSYNSVGERKRADKTALFNGIANFVKSGGDYIQANKQRALSLDIQRLMQAQQGITQAQQALQQNPNDIEAKKALEQDTGIVNLLTKDPKKVKLFQKAFNIDLFGDGKNKEQNQALTTAWLEFNKKQQAGDKTALNPAAQRMMSQQPITQQLNPQAQAQAEAIKAGLQPNAGELIKANVEVYKAIHSAQSADARSDAMVKAEEIRAKATDARTAALIDSTNAKVLGQKQAAEIAAGAKIIQAKSVASTWDKRLAMMDKIAGMKGVDDQTKTLFGTLNKEAQTANTNLKNLLQDNEKIQTELDKKGTSIAGIKVSAANGPDAVRMRQQIGRNNMAIKDEQDNLKMVQQKLDNLKSMGMINMPALAGGNDGGNDTGGDINVNDDEVPE